MESRPRTWKKRTRNFSFSFQRQMTHLRKRSTPGHHTSMTNSFGGQSLATYSQRILQVWGSMSENSIISSRRNLKLEFSSHNTYLKHEGRPFLNGSQTIEHIDCFSTCSPLHHLQCRASYCVVRVPHDGSRAVRLRMLSTDDGQACSDICPYLLLQRNCSRRAKHSAFSRNTEI